MWGSCPHQNFPFPSISLPLSTKFKFIYDLNLYYPGAYPSFFKGGVTLCQTEGTHQLLPPEYSWFFCFWSQAPQDPQATPLISCIMCAIPKVLKAVLFAFLFRTKSLFMLLFNLTTMQKATWLYKTN